MSTTNYNYRITVLLVFISLCTVSGELWAKAAVQYFPQFTTVRIEWNFNKDLGIIFGVGWYYKFETDPAFKLIYDIKGNGDPGDPAKYDALFLNRVTFVGDVPSGDLSISITNLLTSNDTTYILMCRINAVFDSLENDTNVRPIVKSNITAFEKTPSTVNSGKDVSLSCTIEEGKPPPEVQIVKDGVTLIESIGSETQPTTLIYTLKNVTRQSNGKYFCRVSTGGFTTQPHFLDLKVRHPPYWVNPVKELRGCEGHTEYLSCRANGDPAPTIRRFDPDGKEINSKEFELKKFGIYRCEASNVLGNESLNVTISKERAFPSRPTFTSCTYESLSWTAAASAGESVKFTLKYKEDGSDNDYEVLIESTTDNNYSPSANAVNRFSNEKNYLFKVAAENCAGTVESETCLIEGVAPETAESSSGKGGIIAGSVIAVVVVVVAIIIAVVFYMKKKKRDSGTMSLTDKPSKPVEKPIPMPRHKPNDLLYGTDSPDFNDSRPQPTPDQTPGYAEIDRPDDAEAETHTNVPSWV